MSLEISSITGLKLFFGAVQKIRQKFADNIETGGKGERDAGIASNSLHAFPTSRPPNAGEGARAEDARDARNGKSLCPIGMPSCYGGKNRVASPSLETLFVRREIAVVFVKRD